MQICYNCYSLNVIKTKKEIVCNDCSHTISIYMYNKIRQVSKNDVRYGYQYRVRTENDLKRNITGKAYALIELSEIFTFLGLSMASGVVGNFAYDKLKEIISKLKDEPLIIEIDDKNFKRFLKSEAQQKKFIKYIEEYRNQKLPQKKKTNSTKLINKKPTKPVPRKTYR
jgi:hypothetical protein